MVVPPGDVTLSFSRPGCSPVSSAILAAPNTVCAASCRAASRGSPIFTPPSASASMMRKTYAGPLPLRPVTASMSRSSTTTTRPTDSKIARATCSSSAVTCGPQDSAERPACTTDGVFGMHRTTRTPGARRAAMRAIG